MGGKRTRGRKPRIDSAAKVALLAALREGRRLDEVAARCGVTLQAFYSARRRDPLFAAAWRDAHALSAEAERGCLSVGPADCHRPEPGPGGNEARIVPNNRRLLQRRRMRHVRFDERRKGVFLAHFARRGDSVEAAAAAGVCERTVLNHRRCDPVFAAAFQAALEEGYLWLEAEAVRERLGAQRRLRAAIDEAESGGDPLAPGEQAMEFERTMRLLARWSRRGGGLGPRTVGRAGLRRMDFDDAMVLVRKRLTSLGIRVEAPPPEQAVSGAGGPAKPLDSKST